MEPAVNVVGPDNLWVWNPQAQAQSLADLQGLNVQSVLGQVTCTACHVDRDIQLTLQQAVDELRNSLLANREMVLEGRGRRLKELPFANSTKLSKDLCPECLQKAVVPVIPELEKGAAEAWDVFCRRKLNASNLLFLLLNNNMRFFETRDLKELLNMYGFTPATLKAIDLVGTLEPKAAYVPAAAYVLMQVLDPHNQMLKLGSWPVYEGEL